MSSKADVIVGLQWGDEGKGRIVDLYAERYDVIARFAGGDNAGHSIVVGERELALRIVPSGVMHPGVDLFVGGGTVVSLSTLLEEFDALAAIGVDVDRVKISDRAQIVFPYHVLRDRARERKRGGKAIGTTGRGIGPAYEDRVARTGIRFEDLLAPQALAEKLWANDEAADQVISETLEAARRLRGHIVDGVAYIHDRLSRGKRVLCEGAQGTLLDVGYGTYPFVTSSHTIAGGACTGLGIGPNTIGNVVGVLKAYCTRVGAGPFPSELLDERGERMRRQGGEFGTVTGRPRRCGWLDAVAARYAVALNGLTSAVVTKLDVLSGFESLGIITGYRVGAEPASFSDVADPRLDVEIEEMPGWSESIDGVREISGLPANARRYVERIGELLGVPIDCVSVGRERSQLAR
jgi:adenylosuccinate synthase